METITYTVKRSIRKSISILINTNGEVTVKAPLQQSDVSIDRFVQDKKDWIINTLEKVKKIQKERDAFILSKARFLGEIYPVKPISGKQVFFSKNCIEVPDGNQKEMMETLKTWYRAQAKSILTSRVDHFSRLMGLYPESVKITSAKTRWGSCSQKKTINFSWKLIMASGFAIDYVVIHELAHLKYMDHSNQFWALVDSFFPESDKAKAELKTLQEAINNEGWEY